MVEKVYYAYLRLCLSGTGLLFRSSPAAYNLIQYFINALEIFYSTEELSVLLEEQGYCDVSAKAIFSGMLGCHRARKPLISDYVPWSPKRVFESYSPFQGVYKPSTGTPKKSKTRPTVSSTIAAIELDLL